MRAPVLTVDADKGFLIKNTARNTPSLSHKLGRYSYQNHHGETCFYRNGAASGNPGFGMFSGGFAEEYRDYTRMSVTGRVFVEGANAFNGQHLLGNYNYSGSAVIEEGFGVQLNTTNRLRFYDTTSWQSSVSTAVPFDEWFDFAWVKNGTNLKFYLNGENMASFVCSNFSNVGNRVAVGGRRINTTDSDFVWAGGIRRLKVWSRALSQAEVIAERYPDMLYEYPAVAERDEAIAPPPPGNFGAWLLSNTRIAGIFVQ